MVTTTYPYECSKCFLRFQTLEELITHRSSTRKEEIVQTTIDQAITAETAEEVSGVEFICHDCGTSWPTFEAWRGHRGGSKFHGKAIRNPANKSERKLYRVIGNKPGLHARDYSELTHKSRERISQLAMKLKRNDFIVVVGMRNAARYYTKEYFERNREEILATGLKVQPYKEIRKIHRAKPVVSADIVEPAYILGDKMWMNGELYNVVYEKV